MILGNPSSDHIEFSAQRETNTNGDWASEVWVTVIVNAGTYKALQASCIARSDGEACIASLEALEFCRRGEAILWSTILKELRLRIYASDSCGHMAVEGDLQLVEHSSNPRMQFSCSEFDPSDLALLVEERRTATESR